MMNGKNGWKDKPKRLAVLAFAAMLAFAMNVTAYAYVRIDTGAETGLTVHYAGSENGIGGVRFALYRVADVSDAVELTLTPDFADLDIGNINDVEKASDWQEKADAARDYVQENAVEPVRTASTDSAGNVSFEGLSVGLYLLSGDTVSVGEYRYTPVSALILLPTLMDDDTWNYHPDVEPKYSKEVIEKPSDPEEPPAESEEPGEKTEETVPAPAVTPVKPVEPTGTVGIDQTGTPADTLPQTGQVNWPIPYLAAGGLCLIALGIFLKKRSGTGR